MRNIKMIILGLGCMAALCLTSCINNDDSDSGLSNADISRCYKAVLGDYSGKMLYSATNPQDVYDTMDTLNVQWTVNADTILIVKEFPAIVLADQLHDTELKEALKEQNPVQNISCFMAFVSLQDSYIQFIVGPQKVDFPVSYKGSTHTLSVYFWANNSSFGEKDSTSGDMIMRLIIGAACLDGDTSINLLTSYSSDNVMIPIYFTTML